MEKQRKKKIVLIKISLYLISLWILLLLLIVLKLDISDVSLKQSFSSNVAIIIKNNPVSCICAGLAFIGCLGYIIFWDSLNNTKDLPVRIIQCESINYENLSFLATYIIPLVCFPMNTKREMIVMFAVIFIVGWMFVKTNMYYTNPSLVLVGFNVYKIETNSKNNLKAGIVITRGEIAAGDSIKYFCISDNVYFGRRQKNESK